VDDCILDIVRKEGESLRVYYSTLRSFNMVDVRQILDVSNPDFILHAVKEPIIHEGVIGFMDSIHKVLGGYSELFGVIRQGNNWPYWSSETRFIMRGLEQHTKVTNITRLDKKRYRISRRGLDDVVIVSIDDYDLSIESVRSAVDKYRSFDAVFKSNPNGRISTEAVQLAASLGIKVLTWRELLGKLNLKW